MVYNEIHEMKKDLAALTPYPKPKDTGPTGKKKQSLLQILKIK